MISNLFQTFIYHNFLSNNIVSFILKKKHFNKKIPLTSTVNVIIGVRARILQGWMTAIYYINMKAKNVTHADVGFILMTMITGNFYHFYGLWNHLNLRGGAILVDCWFFWHIRWDKISYMYLFSVSIENFFHFFFRREYASSWGRITLKYH